MDNLYANRTKKREIVANLVQTVDLILAKKWKESFK